MMNLLLFLALTGLLIFLSKKYMAKYLQGKIPFYGHNSNKSRNTNLKIGAILSMTFFLLAFNIKATKYVVDDIELLEDTFSLAVTIPPITSVNVPKAPEPAPVIEIKTVKDFVKLETAPKDPIAEFEPDVIEDPEPIIKAEPEPFVIVEDMPKYKNGQKAMMEFLANRIKYPSIALENGIEGTVLVQFVVKKDGSISKLKVVQGIGAGCDEEAVRVIKSMPKWKPGKQRGRAVPVRCVIPVRFKIGG